MQSVNSMIRSSHTATFMYQNHGHSRLTARPGSWVRQCLLAGLTRFWALLAGIR